ncbi:MAG: hypothetical protein WBL28_09415 [Methylotenera sp.]
MKKFRFILFFVIISITATLLSVFYQRLSSEIVQWGNLCGAADFLNCYHPNLSGGFPFAFIFDRPGVSVEYKLSFGEDEFRWYPFLTDIWFYFVMFIFSYFVLKKLRKDEWST